MPQFGGKKKRDRTIGFDIVPADLESTDGISSWVSCPAAPLASSALEA